MLNSIHLLFSNRNNLTVDLTHQRDRSFGKIFYSRDLNKRYIRFIRVGIIILCVNTNHLNNKIMLRYAIIFFVIALVAAAFGFGGIAEGAASIAKFLFYIFVVLFVLTLLFGSMIFKK
jgi:uncharacterized membrane protein YtjA (UPF0391 family)